MKLAISAWSIRNPIPVTVLFIALTLAGVAAYLKLPVKQVPDTSFPTVQITVTQNGAAPAELEAQVTRLAENAVASIPGVNHVISTVTLGQSVTRIEFQIGENEQKATEEVRTAIERIRADFPRSIDEPVIEKLDADALPILTYAVSAPAMSPADLSWFVDDTVASRLQAVAGVSKVARVGGANRAINVILRPDRLAAYGLTAPAVSEALRAFIADNPGGRTRIGGAEQTVRVLGGAADADALRRYMIPTGTGRYVRLADVADVGDGENEPRSFARLDGRPVVGFEITKTRVASDVRVEDLVKPAIAKLGREYPGVRFTEVVSIVGDTRASFSSTVHVLLEGMVLAAFVVWLFLRAWRSTLIAALAMPVSLVPTFAAMAAAGFTLNIITLLGLTLVIGILVDDAIVEIENIEKRIERGETPYEAAFHGADEIGLAVVATTMAIVVIFVPVSLMGGVAGQYFREFGLTVAAAVLFSLLVARLLAPLMAAYLLTPSTRPHERKPFQGRYRKALDWALEHRRVSLLFGILFFAGSIWLASTLPTGFLPTTNPTSLVLDMTAPPGTTAQKMDDAIQDLTAKLKRDRDVELVFARAGGEDFTSATVTVRFREDRASSASAFRQRIRPVLRTIPNLRVTTYSEGGTPADVEIILAGKDGAALAQAAERVQREMRGVPILANVRPAAAAAGPELVIRPKVAETARLGVSAETIASIARVATLGDIDANVAKLSVGERRIPIRARLPDWATQDLSAIAALQVPIANGATTRLGAVADIGFEAGPARIERFDRERRLTLRADLRGGATLGQAVEAITELPAMKALPPGVHQASYGDAEQLAEMLGGFLGAMLAGVGMIFGVLVLLFRSFFKPVTILSALPLSLGGAFLALKLFGLAMTLPALIGLLMLLGLAAKNSILLVEFAIEREREGMSQHDALIEACCERARPIVMTTVAMAAGMLPTALGLGEGAEFRQPMAIAVIGGLISSTALSLVLVPVVYKFIDDFEMWLSPKLARLITKPPEGAHKIEPRPQHG